MVLSYYFVAFLDILGFSDMVKEDCHSGAAPPKFLPLLQEAITEVREFAGETRLVQFSDSIILSLPFQRDIGTFSSFVQSIAALQLKLFHRKILCRGGVAHGKHSENDQLYFSQALVEAYRIESKMAGNPRVVLSNDLIELFPPNGLPLVTDKDSLIFVDFLRDCNPEEVSSILASIEENLTNRSYRTVRKIMWLAEYCRSKAPELVSPFLRDLTVH